MPNVMVDSQSLSDIANTLRSKGATGTFKPSEMAGAIGRLSSGVGVVSYTPSRAGMAYIGNSGSVSGSTLTSVGSVSGTTLIINN